MVFAKIHNVISFFSSAECKKSKNISKSQKNLIEIIAWLHFKFIILRDDIV